MVLEKRATWEADAIIIVDRERASRGLAIALAGLRARPGLADLIENILRFRDDEEVRQRLRDSGIPEEAIRDAMREPSEPIIAPSNVTQQALPAERPVPPPKPIDLTLKPPPKAGGEEPPIAISNEQGRKAEAWLREAIKRCFGSRCKVSDRPVRDSQNRETDILLIIGDREIHIEVKELTGLTIYWSNSEVTKARDFQDRYYMALVRPTNTADEYSVCWLWDPLTDLLGQQRRGVWLWDTSRYEVPVGGPAWLVPDGPPNRQANRFCFRIDVNEGFLEPLPKDLRPLEQQLDLVE